MSAKTSGPARPPPTFPPRGRLPRLLQRVMLPAALLLPLSILGLGLWTAWQATREEARAGLSLGAEATAEHARSLFEAHRLRAQLVDELLAGRDATSIRAEEPALHARLRQVLALGGAGTEPGFTLWVFDRAGRIILNTEAPQSPTIDFSDRGYFRALAAPNPPPVHVDEVVRGRATGMLNFGLSIPRAPGPDGGFNGLVNISLFPERMAVHLGRLAGEESDNVTLLRADGLVLARSPLPSTPPPWSLPADAPALAMMRGGLTYFERAGASPLDAVPRFVAYRQVEGWPLYVSIARDRAVVLKAWRERALLLLGFGLPATLALTLLAFLVRRAQWQAEAANAGLEQRVARRTTELATSEERLRLALEAADLGTWEVDFRAALLQRSPRMLAILGYPPGAAVVPYPTPRQDVHPDDRPALAAATEALRLGEQDRYRLEYRVRRPDGGWVCVEACARVVERDAQGLALRLAGTIQDVTARRDAEERRILLAREVDHRAKNALAVVQAALRLTPRGDAESYAKAVEGRVASLARAHSLLAAERWAGADLTRVLEGELAAFLPSAAAPGAPRAVVEGPTMQVAPAAAQSLSLVFHELATNAVKHGALSAAGGRLDVSWTLDEEGGALVLLWRERGGPPAREATRRGFGSRLVSAVVRDQLGGALRQEWDATGLTVEMRIPLPRVRAGDPAKSVLAPAM